MTTALDARITAWVGDLGAYNSGILRGEWLALPVDEEEEAQKILKYGEEMYIADIESSLPINLKYHTSLRYVNDIATKVEDLEEYEFEAVGYVMEAGYEVDEAIEIVNNGDYRIWYCDSMTDVAYEYVEETGMLDSLPDFAQRYFDYEAFGRDLKIEGNFTEVKYGVILEVIQ
jgi:antirestriction protein